MTDDEQNLNMIPENKCEPCPSVVRFYAAARSSREEFNGEQQRCTYLCGRLDLNHVSCRRNLFK